MTEILVAVSFRAIRVLSDFGPSIRFSEYKQAFLSKNLFNIVYILLIIYMEGNLLATNAPASIL